MKNSTYLIIIFINKCLTYYNKTPLNNLFKNWTNKSYLKMIFIKILTNINNV